MISAPFDSKVVVNGTFRNIWVNNPPDRMTNLGDRPAEARFPSEMTSPQAAAATGAVSITFFILDAVMTPGTGPTAAVTPAPHGFAASGGWSWRF